MSVFLFNNYLIRCFYLLGFVFLSINCWAVNAERKTLNREINTDQDPASNGGEELYVVVESLNLIPIDLKEDQYLVPYKKRRSTWGGSMSFSYSTFQPENYEPDKYSGTFDDIYESGSGKLIEINVSIKKNITLGSFGGVLGVGTYKASSVSDFQGLFVNSTLKLTPVRLGAKFILDNVIEEPIWAPYVEAGTYTMFYSEEEGTSSFNGNTGFGFYYNGGILFQLDWIDPRAARNAYQESGIENTFIFIGVRQFLASSEKQDPDFGTPMHYNAGLSVEF